MENLAITITIDFTEKKKAPNYFEQLYDYISFKLYGGKKLTPSEF